MKKRVELCAHAISTKILLKKLRQMKEFGTDEGVVYVEQAEDALGMALVALKAGTIKAHGKKRSNSPKIMIGVPSSTNLKRRCAKQWVCAATNVALTNG
jgi:hypothetical protein